MRKLRILLVDDNPDDRKLTIRELKKEFDVAVDEVFNADGLESKMDNEQYDMVITDYQLRWSNGLKILETIKDKFPQCPVIMFTGTGNEEIAVEAMKAGLDDYVVKSFKHFRRLSAATRLALERAQERLDRQNAEKALYESEEKFRKLFESSPNAITVSNLNGTIIECNQAALKLHRFSSKTEVIGSNIFDLITERDRKKANEIMKKTLKKGAIKNIEYTLLTKDGHEIPVEVSAGVIMDLSGNPVSIVTLSRDITKQKHAEEELKKRMMKFKMDAGSLYLTKESVATKSIEAFVDLLKIGYGGFVIARTPRKEMKNMIFDDNFEFLWLAEKGEQENKQIRFSDIETRLEGLPRKTTIFIDRLDYLIFKHGFKKTLAFVQHLREIAYISGNIVIVSIDPGTITDKELRLLEKEGDEIELRIDKRKLPEHFIEILKFIYHENMVGVKPSYLNLCKEMRISRPTVRKRVKILKSTGYLFETIKGKNKIVELTERGRNIFLK